MSDIAWAAGLFEGEGCVTLHKSSRIGKHGQEYFYPWLAMKMTDEDVIRRFAAVLGGSVTGPCKQKNPNHKPYWNWKLTKIEEVQATLRSLWPYLGGRRRAKAAEVLAMYYELRTS